VNAPTSTEANKPDSDCFVKTNVPSFVWLFPSVAAHAKAYRSFGDDWSTILIPVPLPLHASSISAYSADTGGIESA
jgi:hypothetical protein